MHVSDGVLSPWVAGAGLLASAALVGFGLRGVEAEDLPRMGVVGAFLFVASLLRVPVGPSSVHLSLYSLGALLLGARVFPVALVVLALQALLLQFGGLLSLGSNVLDLALPAYLAGRLFKALGPRGRATRSILGFACGFFSVLGSASMVGLSLYLSNPLLAGSSRVLVAIHLPVAALEGLVLALLLSFKGEV